VDSRLFLFHQGVAAMTMESIPKASGGHGKTDRGAAKPVAAAGVGQLAIRTAEGIIFTLTLAGPISRCLAWIVDALCVTAIAKLTNVLLSPLGLFSEDFSQAAMIILFFVLNMGYAMALEWFWHGQTVGKRLMRLRVMDLQGLELRFVQIAIRNLLRAVDNLPLFNLVGGLAVLVHRRSQRLGDIAANTVVIQETKASLQIPKDFLASMRYNSLRDHPHLVARLRKRTTPGEAALTMQALLRRYDLEADQRVSLFADIAGHLKAKTEFPAEAIENISDEQFVRNAVDVLFQSSSSGKGRL
jgi:uncharacterized RDD family membrane protein YckC